MEGIRRKHGRPKQKAKALRLDHVVSMLSYLHTLPDSNKKLRDIAILLVGVAHKPIYSKEKRT